MSSNKKTNLQKLLEYAGPNFYGNPSFGGTGNYGMGGYKQLAHLGLNPATEYIANQEQEELEQNIEDQEWINNKYRRGMGFNSDSDPVPHWNGRNGTVETVAESAPYDNSVSRMRDLPGFPAPNTLVEPEQFTPMNAGADYENPIDGRKVEYLGPTLNGIPMDDISGNSAALALQLEKDELIGRRVKKLKKPISKKLDKLIGPDPDLSKDTEHKTDAQELILYDFIKNIVSEYLEEILGAPRSTMPDRLGWNNTRTNSLAAWRNHINPDQPPTETWRPQFGENEEQNPHMIYEPPQRSPLGGFGSIGWPKQFVPADYEATHGDDEGFGEDLLGARRLRQSPTDDDRVGVNASIREARMKQLEALLEYLLNEQDDDSGGEDGGGEDGGDSGGGGDGGLEEGIDEGENAPTNPSLWSRAKAAARSKFDKYPCVSMDSLALTKAGWKSYLELKQGEQICTYNVSTGFLEWKPVINLHYFEDAPTVRVCTPQTNFSFVCTPNHKWVLKKNWKEGKWSRKAYWKQDCLIETKDINQHMKIVTSAKLVPNENSLEIVSFSKNENSWVEKVINMSSAQREAFFASAIVYDGHEKKLKGKYKNRELRFGFSQKNKDHGDALEICAVLLGYRVSYRTKSHNKTMRDWTLSNRNVQSTQNVDVVNEANQAVWCPETENHTWVMKQNGMITITGNSAYANLWASRWYKSKGGGWRKKGKKKK